MKESIKAIAKSLFSSKKFLAMLAGVLVWLSSKTDLFSLSEGDVMPILLLIGTYIGAQGVADLGKEKEKVKVNALKELRAEDKLMSPKL